MIRLRLFKLCCCCCLILSSVVYAQQNTVSPQLYKTLQKSEKLIAGKSYGEARQLLQSALSGAASDYETATVLRSLSSIYALQEDYQKAAETLSESLALNAFPAEQQQQALLNLGQLYMANGQFRKAVNVLEPWLAKNPKPDIQVYVLMANAYAQLKQYRKALPYIRKAINLTQKPPESWYQLNLALVYELQDYAAAAGVLQTLIGQYPEKKQYWEQLGAVHQQMKQYTKAASIKELAYKKGLLNREKEILDLFNLLLYIDAPYKAAVLLDKELIAGHVKNNAKTREQLANAWTLAREFDHAVTALEEASKLTDKGILCQQLGQIFVEQEKWQQAAKALSKAISKGSLKQPGNVYLLLGMSYYELKQTAKARQAFNHAGKYLKTQSAATQWLSYIDNEQIAEETAAH